MTSQELLGVATEAARTAGALLLERFGSERVLATKTTPTDLVSEADLAAERAIREVLAARAPGDAIVGEEGDDLAGTTGRRWIVDPLDGTVNFLFGIPQWCVSVACEGRAGVIFDPVRGELFSATADGPALLGDLELGPPRECPLSESLVGTGFGYDAAQRGRQGEVIARVLPHVRDIRRAGSAALDLAWTAAGRLDAYFEHGVQVWDSAAGELICARAGLDVQVLPAQDGLPAGLLVAHAANAQALRALVSPRSG